MMPSTMDLYKCVPFLRKFVCTVLLIGSFGTAVDLGAAEVEIQVVPRGAEPTRFDGVVPALMPEELLVDPNTAAAFDEINQRWVISVQPLERFLTEMTLELKRPNDGSFPRPPLSIALPYRDAVIKVVIPLSAEPDGARVMAAYRGELPAADSKDWLTDFLQASMLIDFLTRGAGAENVEPTAPLARALVVYAESVDRLVNGTDWFGVPADINQRAEMTRTVLSAAQADGSVLSSHINVSRLQAAFQLIKQAEHRLYWRIWTALYEIPRVRCNETLPIFRSFYDHLRQMPVEQYVLLREAAKFTRTQVLLASTRCFRELLTIEPGARYAHPLVIAGPFGGRPARVIAAELREDLERELRKVSLESEDTGVGESECESSSGGSPVVDQICSSLAYLTELDDLLIEENADVS